MGTIYDVAVYQKQIRARESNLCNNNNEYRCEFFTNYTTCMPNRQNAFYVIDIPPDNSKKTPNSTESAVALPAALEQSQLGKIALCFSCYTNTKIIMDTKLNSEAIPPIHGLRFLGMIWIIMIHTIFYMSDYVGECDIDV